MTVRNSTSTSNKLRTKRILLVGDWLVDEHWVTGVHRSPTSSRTGLSHLRALQLPHSTTQSFCGAGRTASILHQAGESEGGEYFDVAGLGVWHPADTDALAAMLNPSNLRGHTLHRMTQERLSNTGGRLLFNLADLQKGSIDEQYGTTRIIRIYQHTGDKISLTGRVDWEVAPSDEKFPWSLSSTLLDQSSELKLFLDSGGRPFDAVVVKDLCKRVVTPVLVEWLAGNVGKGVPWYISTKEWLPEELFCQLSKVNLRLLMIPPVAAQTALRKNFLNAWMAKANHPSKGAIEQLDGVCDALGKKDNLRIVLLPDTNTILCLDRLRQGVPPVASGDCRKGILSADIGVYDSSFPLPMASVFFGALVADELLDQSSDPKKTLSRSLSFTSEWREFERGRIEKPESWTPEKEPRFSRFRKDGYSFHLKEFSWSDERKLWKRAFSHLGTLGDNNELRIELWRSMTEVKGYVCCVAENRQVLRSIVKMLRSFSSSAQVRNKGCMIVAPPGSGKTHLVRSLVRSSGLRYLRFNITQMVSKIDILDCFDTIVTTQAQNRDESLLVFVDEINAKLNGQYVYDAFLAPLDEGVYIRAGKAFHIDPCFWLFAGTKSPRDSVRFTSDGSEKASDFESRLSLPPLFFKMPDAGEARIEKVYLGVSILRATYPDVHSVTEKVLKVLHGMRSDIPVRDLVHFVRAFRDIQYGEVAGRNVPTDWLSRYKHPEDARGCGIDVEQWRDQPEGQPIEIIS